MGLGAATGTYFTYLFPSRGKGVPGRPATFQLEDGWGYRIVMNEKVLIYQPTIPAIDTLRSFPDEASARKIGALVLERLNNNENFSITMDDIKHSLSDLETNDNST